MYKVAKVQYILTINIIRRVKMNNMNALMNATIFSGDKPNKKIYVLITAILMNMYYQIHINV